MRKLLIVLSSILLLGLRVTNAAAVPYEFEDTLGFDANDGYIATGEPLFYQHDINSQVDFANGDTITDATLELTFNDDDGDSLRLSWNPRNLVFNDTRKFALVGYDYESGRWKRINDVGEINDGKYEFIVGVDCLNNDGFLDVGIGVWNFSSKADVRLESSVLSGHADGPDTLPVPELPTLLLVGSGLLALVSFAKKKFF